MREVVLTRSLFNLLIGQAFVLGLLWGLYLPVAKDVALDIIRAVRALCKGPGEHKQERWEER